MGSYNRGKLEVIEMLKQRFPKGSTCLDVGACDGKWAYLLDGYFKIDAVEAYEPNIEEYCLKEVYDNVYNTPMEEFSYDHYDLIIFGDVIEHITVENSQRILKYGKEHSKGMLVVVPFLYYQDEMYGNPYEKHLQPDLTPKTFKERYGEWEVLWEDKEYCYYYCGE